MSTQTQALPSLDWASFHLDVSPFLDKISILALCHTHALFREQLIPFVRGVRQIIHQSQTERNESIDRHLMFAVRTKRCDMCQLVREIEARIPRQVRAPFGSPAPKPTYARAHGWDQFDWNRMLGEAARIGSRDICELARSWGANRWTGMACGAARGGSREMCILAREWSIADGKALDWSDMMRSASLGGSCEVCKLVREWTLADRQQVNFDAMLIDGATGNSREICLLARQWKSEYDKVSIPNMFYEGMLGEAARNRWRELCLLAHSWIVEARQFHEIDWDRVLHDAVIGGDLEICRLVHKWSTVSRYRFDWAYIFEVVKSSRHRNRRELYDLLRELKASEASSPILLAEDAFGDGGDDEEGAKTE